MKDRSYKMYIADLATGRGGRKAIARNVMLTKREDDTLVFTFTYHTYRGELLELRPNDEFTLMFPDDRRYTNTLYNRVRQLTGLSLYHNSERGVAQTLRVALKPAVIHEKSQNYPDGYYWKWPTVPYIKGLRSDNDGYILNREIAVDYVRRLNFDKARPFRRTYAKLHKLLRVAARMKALEGWEARPSPFGIMSESEFANINWQEPTMEDAEKVFAIGSAWGAWNHQRNPDYQEKYLKTRTESGLRKFREWLYETHGCYEMVPLTYTKE